MVEMVVKGDIYFEAVDNLNTLIDFRYQQHFKAESGKNGAGKNKTGHSGKDIFIKVPVGTVILSEDKKQIYKDLKEKEIYLAVVGGMGGKWNFKFKSTTNQAPRRFQQGIKGQEMWVWLRLKLIADIGFVGVPNWQIHFVYTLNAVKDWWLPLMTKTLN